LAPIQPQCASRRSVPGASMIRKWFSVTVLALAASSLLSLSSCAHNQHLVSIALQPSGGFVFEGFNAQGQFTALGTYIHPPVTKDISSQVTWSLDVSNFGTLTQTGQITYNRTDGCGSGNVTATFNDGGNLVTGSAPVRGVNDGTSSCGTGGSGPALTVTFAGNGVGSVTSSPAGLNCPSPAPCVAQFASGTLVTLTANPTSPSTFASWSNCDSNNSTNPCTLTLTSNRTATVTLN
jgi:hypothetical protein